MGVTSKWPTLAHDGEPWGTVIQEFSVRSIDWRTRLLALTAVATLAAICCVPLWWEPVAWVVLVALLPICALILAIAALIPSLFMKSGEIREYLTAGDTGDLWLIRDNTSHRIAVPIDERTQVTRLYLSKKPDDDRGATWFVGHPSTLRRHRPNQGEPGLRVLGLAGRSMEDALRKVRPGLTVAHEVRVSAGAA